MTKVDEVVRRLPTKNRLELFIKNSGFRGVVLMDRIVFCVEVQQRQNLVWDV